MAMKNSNKRQLITSIMSLGLSVTMLMGTTLAWFTDSSGTKVNTIQAGKLDVDLTTYDEEQNKWVSVEGQPLNFKDSDGNTLWEPGATFELPELRIENKGNLALKFKLIVNGVVGNTDLAEVIDVSAKIKDSKGNTTTKEIGTLRELMNDSDGAAHGTLLADANTDSYKLAFRMQKDADNRYQGQSISGISFTVLATQHTYENDSFGFDYDKGAEYDNAQLTLDQVKSALNAGENFTFAENITVKSGEIESSPYGTTGLNHTNGGVIDGNGKTLTVNGANGTYGSAIYTNGGTIKNLTVKGGFRGIFINDLKSDLIIDNVNISDSTYTISCDQTNNYNLIVKNSTLNGWTSYASGFKGVYFTNCNFGEGSGYKFMRPYNPTTLTNCDFETGFTLDATKTTGIVIENCRVNGVAITQENITELLGTSAASATVK